MDKMSYIADEEKEKCRMVVDAFAELYELTDVVVVDAGKYGFAKLQYYKPGEGFDSTELYTSARELFDNLWQIWFEYQVLDPVLGTPLSELDYDEIFQTFSKDRQEEILAKKKYFERIAGDKIR